MQTLKKDSLLLGTKAGTLAAKIKQDIAMRGLKSGDRYFNAQELGGLYGVSTVTAHRALSLLADEDYVVRQRRSGTFVGGECEASKADKVTSLRVVHILMPISYCDLLDVKDRLFVEAIQLAIPGAAVQVHYVPEFDPFGYTKRVVEQVKPEADTEGLVLIRSNEQMQRYVAEQKLNAVVFGSVYSQVHDLACVDVDQAQTGKLMAEYALSTGFKDFALLMFNGWRYGDNILFDSITDTLGKAGIGLGSFQQRSLPTERYLIDYEIKRIIAEAQSPLMFLCRSDYFADAVVDVANSMGLFYGQDIAVISGGHFRTSPERKYPCVVPVINLREQIFKLIEILVENISGKNEDKEQNRYVIPVELNCE